MLLVLLNLWVLMCVLRERCWVIGCWVLLTLLGSCVLLKLLKCVATLEYWVKLLSVDLYAEMRTRGGLLLSCVATLGYCAKLLGNWMLRAIEKAGVLRKAAGVAAAGVLPEGCWTFGAVMLGVLTLSEEVVLGVDLRAVEYLVHCAFIYSKLTGVGCCWSCWCGFAARYWSAAFRSKLLGRQ